MDHRTRPAHRWGLTLLMLASSVALVALPQGAGAAAPAIGVTDSVRVIRPGTTPAGLPTQADLVAARHEYESFQVVVSGPATSVSVNGDLFGWSSTHLAREDYYTSTIRSDQEGWVGRTGDALIPEKDQFYGENRNAFPFDVPDGENRVVWVDVYVPPGTPAGTYADSLTLSSASGSTAIPVTLEVLNLTLPEQPSFDSLWMVQNNPGNAVCEAHTGTSWCTSPTERARLTQMYSRLALENGMNLGNGFGLAYDQTPASYPAAVWEDYLEGPLVTGTSPAHPATNSLHHGARLLEDVASYAYLPYQCRAACADAWEAEAEEPGEQWADKQVWYGCDDHSGGQSWQTCYDNVWGTAANPGAQRAHPSRVLALADWPDYSTRGAPGFDASILATYVELMQPYGKPSIRSQYDAWLQDPAHTLWLVTACGSFGCDENTEAAYMVGRPGYAIDAPGNQSRAMPWFAERFGATGEMNWSATQKLATAWNTGEQFESGGNGDGTMFYPGLTSRIGGAPGTDIPLESVRLKRRRDGVEDYELMAFLKTHGYAAQVAQIVATLYPDMNSATQAVDASGALVAARTQLADLVRQATNGTPEPSGRIVWASDRDGDFEIYNMAATGGDIRTMTDNTVADRYPAWSKDSTRLAWSRGADVWVMNANGTGAHAVTASPAGQPASKPAWTADGQIVYVQRTAAGRTELWVMEADGTDKRRLVGVVGADLYDPAAAPGGVIYYSQSNAEGGADIHQVDLDGTDAAALQIASHAGPVREAIAINPDTSRWVERKYAISAAGLDSANYDLFWIDASGFEVGSMKGPANAFQLAYSPDGAFQTWVTDASGNLEIAGLTNHAAADVEPDWGAPLTLPPVVPPTSPTTPTGPTDPTATVEPESPSVSQTTTQAADPTSPVEEVTQAPPLPPLSLVADARARQRQGTRVRVRVGVTASRAGQAKVTGVIRFPGGRARLKPVVEMFQEADSSRARLTVSKGDASQVLRAVRRWRRADRADKRRLAVRVTLRVVLTTPTGRVTATERLTLT